MSPRMLPRLLLVAQLALVGAFGSCSLDTLCFDNSVGAAVSPAPTRESR